MGKADLGWPRNEELGVKKERNLGWGGGDAIEDRLPGSPAACARSRRDSVTCNLARSEALEGFNVYMICLLIFQYCCWDLGNSWRFRVAFLPLVSRRISHLLLTCLPRGSSEEAQPHGMDLGGRGSPGPAVMICKSHTAASGNKAK